LICDVKRSPRKCQSQIGDQKSKIAFTNST
jgi:hypothetical protein